MVKIAHIFTARKRSLRRLCFHRCLSVHRGGVFPIACWDTPRADTLLGRHPLWADTPIWAEIPRADNPVSSTCWDTHIPLPSACWDTHTPPAQCMLPVNKQAVRIPLECSLVCLLYHPRAANTFLKLSSMEWKQNSKLLEYLCIFSMWLTNINICGTGDITYRFQATISIFYN